MGYRVNDWEVDFHIPADKAKAALAEINADPSLSRPCWNRAHIDGGPSVEAHDCQNTKPFDSLAEAVEELTGFHDCQEDDIDGFRLGYHLDKWCDDAILYTLARYADEGCYVRLIGEDNDLFGYRVIDGKLHTESATVAWKAD